MRFHLPFTLRSCTDTVYTEIIVSFTLVTANLVLYLYYRKEPDVKATSYVITMTIFVSCYLLMLYLVLLASSFILLCQQI